MRSPDREFECRNDGGESARSGGDDAKKKVGGTVCTRDEMEGRQRPEDTRLCMREEMVGVMESGS